MAQSVTLVFALPATRTDGSALAPSDIGFVNIYRQDNGSDPVRIASVPATETSYVDAGLADGTYAYTVSVTDTQNPARESAASNEIVVVVLPPKAAPSPPPLVSAVASG